MKPTVTSTRILKLKGYLYEVFLQCEYAHTRDVTLLLQFEQQSCSSNQVRSSLHSAARLQHKNQLYTHSHTHTHTLQCVLAPSPDPWRKVLRWSPLSGPDDDGDDEDTVWLSARAAAVCSRSSCWLTDTPTHRSLLKTPLWRHRSTRGRWRGRRDVTKQFISS